MKLNQATAFALTAVATLGAACAQSLYQIANETDESVPLKWSVGISAVWDSNITPTIPSGNPGYEDDAWSINPYVAVAFTNVSPQTTVDLYARVGVNYYLDDSEVQGADDTTANARLGFDLTHRINERLRFSSRNFVAYEMEPEYSYGISTPRGLDPYTYWSSDNSVGYRWTERVGSYTGLALTGYMGDGSFTDRDSWSVYHQMRYQLNARSVATAEYRYTEWGGDAGDSENHYITAGLEHRMSPTSLALIKAGVQLRDSSGESNSSPFLEAALNTQVNSRFSVQGFARYSVEDYDTVQTVGANIYEFADQQVLRIGLNGSYALTPRLSGFGGVDYVFTTYDGGNEVGGGAGTTGGKEDDVINLYVGLRAKINDCLTAEASVNYTDSGSDFVGRDYDRIRLSAGVNYSF